MLSSFKSIVKLALQSRRVRFQKAPKADGPIAVLGNGPSLADDLALRLGALRNMATMAVNFAANAPDFAAVKPDYYILADPHFFCPDPDPNVSRLWSALASGAEWGMTLFVPAARIPQAQRLCPGLAVAGFNPVGVEGWQWLENLAYSTGRGMPRPRNVLIPAIMVAMSLGFKEIYLLGADHSWTRTLSVNDANEVVSIQPHFYRDSADEAERVAQVYRGVRLHDIMESFTIAFRSYHRIARYAASRGIGIFNATPCSFIDAFPRRPIPSGKHPTGREGARAR